MYYAYNNSCNQCFFENMYGDCENGMVILSQGMPFLENEELFNKTVNNFSTGEFSFDPVQIIKNVINIITDEVTNSREMIISILLVCVVSSITYLMNESFKSKGAGQASFYACFCIVCSSAIRYFSIALEYTKDVITVMSTFVTKLSPLMSSMLVLSGKVTSAAAFHPVLSTGVYIVALVVENCLLPLITYGTVLSVVNNMSSALRFSGVCKLINSTAKWVLAASFTLFSGLCGIYGFSAPALDAMGAKTVKFAVGSLVPVVGGFVSETLETVLGGSAMMKSIVGSAGITAICVMSAVPAIKLSIIILMFKICAAVTEPVTDKRISKLLWDISGAVTMLFGMVVTFAILFIICISIIISSTR